MQTEDGQIIHECLNGDPAEFGLLVDKYKEGVYAIAYSRLGNFHDAQDITQETFIKAYTKLRTLKYWDSFAMWLGAIANNLCRQLIRSRSRQPDREFAEDNPPEIIDRFSIRYYQDNSIYQSLNDALESLPETYRQVLVLHYLSGMKSMEIARMLGVSLRTVTERLRMGRDRLREEMIAVMGATFREQKLPAGFTFRIVELVKRIRIHPVSTTKGLPWGLSIVTGIITAIMIINPANVRFSEVETPVFAPLPAETKALKVGEIPVDVFKTSNMSILSSNMGKGKGGEINQPEMENAFFMAPQGEGGTWTRKADMPTARYTLSTSVVNGKIYAIGGTQNEQTFYSIVEEFDPATNTWTKRADMPTARGCLSTSVVNGKIYAIGGVAAGPGLTSAVEEYNPLTDKWTKKANMPTARFLLSASAVNGKIYAIGGSTGVAISIVEEYDPATDTWTKRADMPTARGYLATIAVNGMIYAMGGQGPGWGPNAGGGFFSTVEAYDPVKDRWTEKAKMPSEKGAFGICAVNEKIYTIAGVGFPMFSEVEEYDPATDTWAKITDIPTKRWGLSAAAVGGRIYAIGGSTAGPIGLSSSIVEEYDTGFVSQKNVEAKGKFDTSWGEIKSKR